MQFVSSSSGHHMEWRSHIQYGTESKALSPWTAIVSAVHALSQSSSFKSSRTQVYPCHSSRTEGKVHIKRTSHANFLPQLLKLEIAKEDVTGGRDPGLGIGT